MINIVLCFDKNYFKIGFLFLHTLLSKITEKINIYLILDSPDSFHIYEKKLKSYKNLNSLNLYQFKEDLSEFKNLVHGHVSEATYYRLFLQNYLPPEIEYIFYIDADIVCYQDPTRKLNQAIEKLRKSEYLVSAKTEYNRTNNTNHFEKIGLQSNNYFNAGVLCIDYQQWLTEEIPLKLIDKIKNNNEKLIFWDQDILNKEIDGDYLELGEALNFQINLGKRNKDLPIEELFTEKQITEMTFIHYSGSAKPWSVRGALYMASFIYSDAYYDLYREKYNIVNKWRLEACTNFLIEGILKLKIKNLKYPISFVWIFIKSLVKKSN